MPKSVNPNVDPDDTPLPNNRDDRVNRVQPQLSCSYCRPNRGENTKRLSGRKRMRQQGPTEKTRDRGRAQAREMKNREQTDS